MTEKFVIAIDIGTSAARAVLFDLSAKPVRVIRQPYSLLSPRPGWSEQYPDEIVKAVVICLQEISRWVNQKSEILCVTFSSQMYSILVMDQDGNAVTNSITWNDRRSEGIVDELRTNQEFRKLIYSTGCPISEIFPIYKILWLKQNISGHSSLKFVSIKDYVIEKLTGNLISDWSIASASGLFNVNTKQWNEEVLSFLGLDYSVNLPALTSPRTVINQWERKNIDLGILDGTPIVLGGGDGPLASLGIGAAYPGSVAINVGTSAAFRVTVDTPLLDTKGKLWTFVADEGLWVTGGITGGGIVYDWLIHTYFRDMASPNPMQTYQHVDQLVQSVRPGADGLLFIPYISGEQSPNWNTKQRGGFVGLRVEHGIEHFSRAVLEGLAFSLYRIANAVSSNLKIDSDRIYMSGGITNSNVWLQLAADVFGCDVFAQENTEGSAKGSALLGLLAHKIITKLGDLSAPDAEYKIFKTNEENHKAYKDIFARFEDVLKSLHN